MDLIEAEDIKKRWQEYTEELCKKDLHDTDKHDGVITHLELDILQCGRPGFDPWVGKIPWRRERLPTPVLWPREFCEQYSP